MSLVREKRHGCPELALLLLAALASPSNAGGGTPAASQAEAVVSHLQAGLLRLDREQAGRSDRERAAAFAPLIDETHDLDYMARLTLGREWSSLSDADQREFVGLFRAASVMDYARRFRGTEGARFRVTGAQAVAGGRLQVDTALEAPDEEAVPLRYLLHETAGGWRIVNIFARGVSDLALQRSQHQRILATGGIDALDKHLRTRAGAAP